MWTLASCRGSIFRGSTTDPTYGHPVPNNTTPLYVRVLAQVDETSSRVWDPATQTPRVVRSVVAQMPSTTDILTGDRFRDDTHGVLYVVQNVTRPQHAGRRGDVEVGMKRVGDDGG